MVYAKIANYKKNLLCIGQMDYYKASLRMHEKKKGKIEVTSKVPVRTKEDLSIAYTPGVAEPCREIAKDKELVYKYTLKQNSVAVVSDGSAVLGLGDIGPYAAIPVMEGKAVLFKEFAGIDAFPICIATQDVDKIVETVKLIAPVFGGVNLEDISAPRCFEVEARLKKELGIPVMHDDQHGTAVVLMAGLINAAKVTKKEWSSLRVIINGAGAAGMAIARFLLGLDDPSFTPVQDVVLCDTQGMIYEGRPGLEGMKKIMAPISNKGKKKGDLKEAMKGMDVFIGVSKANLVTEEMVKSMNKKAIIFALANPVPEIMPDLAKKAGAAIVATGRSDFPNQVNNVLAFPGIFRGALDARSKEITTKMKLAAARAIAACVKKPSADKIIPSPFDKAVVKAVSKSVFKAAKTI